MNTAEVLIKSLESEGVKYAESMHLKGYRIERTEDLPGILREAFRQKVPSFIECPVDYSANMELSQYLKNLKI